MLYAWIRWSSEMIWIYLESRDSLRRNLFGTFWWMVFESKTTSKSEWNRWWLREVSLTLALGAVFSFGKQPIYEWVGRFFNRIYPHEACTDRVAICSMLWSTHDSRVLIMRPRWNFVVLRLQPFCNKLRRAQWRMRFSISTQLLDMKYHLKKRSNVVLRFLCEDHSNHSRM